MTMTFASLPSVLRHMLEHDKELIGSDRTHCGACVYRVRGILASEEDEERMLKTTKRVFLIVKFLQLMSLIRHPQQACVDGPKLKYPKSKPSSSPILDSVS